MVGMSSHYILDVPAPKVPSATSCGLVRLQGAPPRCASRVSVPYVDTLLCHLLEVGSGSIFRPHIPNLASNDDQVV
jgi:hypothetical protein